MRVAGGLTRILGEMRGEARQIIGGMGFDELRGKTGKGAHAEGAKKDAKGAKVQGMICCSLP